MSFMPIFFVVSGKMIAELKRINHNLLSLIKKASITHKVEVKRMARVEIKCSACDGVGSLPPLGDAGDGKDVKRFFPRPCEACNYTGKVYTEMKIEESGNKNEGYVAGQGDC